MQKMLLNLLWPGVSIGTANFINPTATIDTIKGIEEFMDKNNIKTLDEIRGIID